MAPSEMADKKKREKRENLSLFVIVVVLAAICVFLISHLPDDRDSAGSGDSHATLFQK